MAMHMAFLYADHIAASRRRTIAEDVRRVRGGRRRPRHNSRNPHPLPPRAS
jgi:hypothetical protein